MVIKIHPVSLCLIQRCYFLNKIKPWKVNQSVCTRLEAIDGSKKGQVPTNTCLLNLNDSWLIGL